MTLRLVAMRLVAAALAAAVAAATWWALALRPTPLPDARATTLPCVSYAPFRGSETPFDPAYRVSRERIREDFIALKALTPCVRTYAVDQGLDAVPDVARETGMKVHLGLWIGRNADENRIQIEAGVRLAEAYPDVVASVIVGNEVLLRREQPPEALAALVSEVRDRVTAPVTYADVWEFWLQNPALANAVDVVTVHLLPYWEDEPIAVDAAIDHAVAVYRRVEAAFPGKRLFVGEIGWPARGRMREAAAPGTVEQTLFARHLTDRAIAEGIDYNFVEAFDQPWKRALEGTVGGAWGVFAADRTQRVLMTGAVVAPPELWRTAGASLLLGLVLAIAARPRNAAAMALGAAGGQGLGAVLALSAEVIWLDFRTWSEVLGGPFWFVWLVIAAAAALDAAVARLDGRAAAAPGWIAPAARLSFLAYAATVAVEIALDPRYRDFPLAETATFAATLGLFALAGRRWALRPEETALAILASAAFCLSFVREGPENTQALAWLAASLVFIATTIWCAKRSVALPLGPPLPSS